MSDNNLYKTYTLIELLNEINLIKKYIYPNKPCLYSEITKEQHDIYKVFDINPPQ
jgi:hypothetical protein